MSEQCVDEWIGGCVDRGTNVWVEAWEGLMSSCMYWWNDGRTGRGIDWLLSELVDG